MTDHTFVVSYEYGYEGSAVQGVFLTRDAAIAHADTLLPGYLHVTEWAGAARVRAWRKDYDGAEWEAEA